SRTPTPFDWLPRHGRQSRFELLRPAWFGGAAGEFRRNREGRNSRASLVPARARDDAGRSRLGADFVVGLDVRVPDAVAGDARAGGQPARADQSAGGAPPDKVRRRAWNTVGRLGVRVQRARPRVHLSILELRRAGTRAQAWAERECCNRTLRDGAGRNGRSAGSGAELLAAAGRRRTWPLRLVRGAGLHAVARSRGRERRDRARI